MARKPTRKQRIGISFIIPTYNERDNISPLIEGITGLITREGWNAEILVIDDNSPDGTSQAVKRLKNSLVRLKVRKANPGFGLALREGTRMARGEFIVWLMGDASDDLGVVPEMVSSLEEGYDLVIGSRYMKGGSRGELQLMKSLLGRTYSTVARWLYRLDVHDVTNGFRAFRKTLFERLSLRAADFSVSPEMVLEASRLGARIGEVPADYKQRKGGESKFRYRNVKPYGLLLLRTLVRR